MNHYPSCKTCKLCMPAYCHPWNSDVGKGKMSERLGYVCLLFTELGFNNGANKVVFMETNTGTCECHTINDKVNIVS